MTDKGSASRTSGPGWSVSVRGKNARYAARSGSHVRYRTNRKS